MASRLLDMICELARIACISGVAGSGGSGALLLLPP